MYRRSFHYNKDLSVGHKVSEEDLIFVRPGNGVDYTNLDNVLGQNLCRDVAEYEPCKQDDVNS